MTAMEGQTTADRQLPDALITTTDPNVRVFNNPAVVDYYDHETSLHECERLLFQTFLKNGMALLDLGVGAGRTTPYLSEIAGRYVGVDYSDAMIAKCRSKFPKLSFLRMDASNMSPFPDASFDAIVFSFNGIDCIHSDEARANCLRECFRLLTAGGVFILSSHNARYLFFTPVLQGVGMLKKAWRIGYAAFATMRSFLPRIAGRVFWRGSGYVRDGLSCGRPIIYVSTPAGFSAELQACGFTVVSIVGAQHPRAPWMVTVPWHYYVCVKT
jgi:ubiquinone/menaquinone biosynthesis C-methylase UbiE